MLVFVLALRLASAQRNVFFWGSSEAFFLERARPFLVGPGSPLGCIYGRVASLLVRVDVYPN